MAGMEATNLTPHTIEAGAAIFISGALRANTTLCVTRVENHGRKAMAYYLTPEEIAEYKADLAAHVDTEME